jgi:hypothetical protein
MTSQIPEHIRFINGDLTAEEAEQFKARFTGVESFAEALARNPSRPASLAEALAAFQAELPPVAKTKTAKVQGETLKGVRYEYEYKYADLADVSEAVLPLLGKHGLSFTCQPTRRGDGQFGLAYQLRHSSGELIDGWYPLDASKKMQVIGGDITYARRYCLSAVTGVAAEEDTDARGSDDQPRASRAKQPPRPFDELPRNQDGSLSRSRCTDEELRLYGAMDDKAQRAHNALERAVLGTDSNGKTRDPQGERITELPPDDLFYDAQPAPLRTPQPARGVVGVIHREFTRLGFEEPRDREQRLGIISAIIGRKVASTNDLDAGEALEVKRLISACRDQSVLAAKLLERQQETPDA